MKVQKMVMIGAMAFGVMQVSYAEEPYAYSAGAKVWAAESDDGDGLLFGPTFSMDMRYNTFLSAKGVFGSFEYDHGSVENLDVELVLGKSWQWLDFGVGFTYISGAYEDTELIYPDASGTWREHEKYRYEYDEYGLLLYLATGAAIFDSPLGWYVGTSAVPVTYGDLDGAGTFFSVEAGFSYSTERVAATGGYRFRQDLEEGYLNLQGFAASVSYRF